MVFQHFKLVQNFTVLENIVLGAEEGALLNTSLSKARRVLADLAREYELDVDPDALIEDLSVGHQQRVEILKALYRQADILILDEPTGVLTPDEADHLFRILRGLKEQGKTVILITHKLREIMEATDNVSVMRRGTMVATVKTAETNPESLAELMVGRKVLLEVEKAPAKPGDVVLSVKDLRVKDDHGVERLKGVSFDIRAGEILGIAGVAGNGQSELLAALGGMAKATGQITMKGANLPLSGKGADGQSRRAAGIAHVVQLQFHRAGEARRRHLRRQHEAEAAAGLDAAHGGAGLPALHQHQVGARALVAMREPGELAPPAQRRRIGLQRRAPGPPQPEAGERHQRGKHQRARGATLAGNENGSSDGMRHTRVRGKTPPVWPAAPGLASPRPARAPPARCAWAGTCGPARCRRGRPPPAGPARRCWPAPGRPASAAAWAGRC